MVMDMLYLPILLSRVNGFTSVVMCLVMELSGAPLFRPPRVVNLTEVQLLCGRPCISSVEALLPKLQP